MAPLPPSLRPLIQDILAKADLDSVTPSTIRADLESIQTAQKFAPPADTTRHIPSDFDLAAHKKELKVLIRECYDEIKPSDDIGDAEQKPANGAASLLKREPDSTSASPAPKPKAPVTSTTFSGGGGLALPGLGGVRGSHASPTPSTSTSTATTAKPPSTEKDDAALAAKLQKEWDRKTPNTRGAATSSGSASKKRKSAPVATKGKKAKSADVIDSDEDSELEGASDDAAPANGKSGSRKKVKKDKGEAKSARAANPNNPFNRPMLLNPLLAEICGADEVSQRPRPPQLYMLSIADPIPMLSQSPPATAARRSQAALGLRQGPRPPEPQQQAPDPMRREAPAALWQAHGRLV